MGTNRNNEPNPKWGEKFDFEGRKDVLWFTIVQTVKVLLNNRLAGFGIGTE